jgi:hypothetical protein
LVRTDVLAAATALAAAVAAAVWTAHPAGPRAQSAPAPPAARTSPYALAKIGLQPYQAPRSDIPYGR